LLIERQKTPSTSFNSSRQTDLIVNSQSAEIYALFL